MTVGIGAICENESGVVLAADTMVTNRALSLEFEHQNQKMTQLSENCVALTSGDALAHTELFGAVINSVTQLRQPSVVGIVEQIKETYQLLRRRQIEERILKPKGFNNLTDFYQIQSHLIPDVAMNTQMQIDQYRYGLDILVAGVNNGRAHLYGINDPGTSYCFDSIGFHAIGSGAPHALNTLIARGSNSLKDLNTTVMIVFEAKKIAERAPGVGSKLTDIIAMNSNTVTYIPRSRMHELEKIHRKWVRREEDWLNSLNNFLGEIENANETGA